MTTLAQARKALNEAHLVNTAEAWQLAALAFAAASQTKARKPSDGKHMGKTPIMHVGRCTLSNGYSVRVSIGQFKGDTVSDSLARLERFTVDCYRAEHLCVRAVRGSEGPRGHLTCYPWHTADDIHYLPCKPWTDGARFLPCPHDVVECRIVKYGSGPDAGVDLENLPMMAAAE